MDVCFYSKPQTLIFPSVPLSSPTHPSHFPLRSQFLGSGIRACPSARCRHLGHRPGPSCLVVRASMLDRNLLIAVAFAVANFAAIRLFFLNYARSKRASYKLSGSDTHDIQEGPAHSELGGFLLKGISIKTDVEDMENLYDETKLDERGHILEDSNNRNGFDEETLSASSTSPVNCERKVTSKLSEKMTSEVLSYSVRGDSNALKKERKDITLPSVMINALVETIQSKRYQSGIPEVSSGSQVKSETRPEVPIETTESVTKEALKCINEDVELSNESVEGERHVSSFDGLSKYVREDISSFYEEKQSELRTISSFNGLSMKFSYAPLQQSEGFSPLTRPDNFKGVEEHLEEFSHESFQENVPVGCFKDNSVIRSRDSTGPLGFSTSRRRHMHQAAERVICRSAQQNKITARKKTDRSEFLSTYARLLRAGRLTDCVAFLENIDEEGLLDMDKVYHARFYKACRSKKAVKEAFSFTKLIKKPTLSTFNMLLSVCASSKDQEGPLEVLRLVEEAGLKADCKLYTTLISTCAKTGKVDTMFEVFHEMVNVGIEPNVRTYGALIDGCARAGQVAKAFGAYGIMRSKKVKPDRVIFNALITACGQSGAVDRAFDVLAEMKAEAQPIDPDHVTIGALIKTCTQAGQVDRAREVYKMIHQYNIKGTPEVYTIAVNSCSEAGDLKFALSVYEDMQTNDVVPDEMFFSALIDVAGHSGNLDVAFEVLQDAKSQGVKLGNILYSSLMGACSKAKSWDRAIKLYEDLKAMKLLPTVSTLNALITSLCDGDQLHKSVDILAEMKQAGIHPNDITYNILLVACEKKDEVELGFELFSQAKKDGLVPNLLMCKCLTGLCLQRFERASSIGEPILSFTSGKPQMDNKWTSLALVAYRETISAGGVPSVEVFSQVLGCLRLPRDNSIRKRLVENLGISSNASRSSNLYSLLEGFGEYDPRSFSLFEEAASLGIVPCVSFKESPIVIDARKLEIHTAEVYVLTIMKGLKHRLAAGAKLPNISILLPVEKTQIISNERNKTIDLAGRVGQAVGSMLRRLGLRYQGKESVGKIRISGLALKRWLQPKLTTINLQFGGIPSQLGSSPMNLHKEITNQQRNIRTSNFYLE